MLELGFRGDMDQIGAAIRPERQTAFFSATWAKEVQSLACTLCTDTPVAIRVGGSGKANGENGDALMAREGITQEVIVVDFPAETKPWVKQEEEKNRLLEEHIRKTMQEENTKMIVFVNQKNFADELSEKLWKEGISCDALHGGRPQETRLWVLDKFRKGETRLLIATDVMGRGLDVPAVTHVVVYSMGGIEDYITRSSSSSSCPNSPTGPRSSSSSWRSRSSQCHQSCGRSRTTSPLGSAEAIGEEGRVGARGVVVVVVVAIGRTEAAAGIKTEAGIRTTGGRRMIGKRLHPRQASLARRSPQRSLCHGAVPLRSDGRRTL